MIDRSHDLPIAKQAKALGISRGSVYSLPRPVSAADLAIMRRIDELHLNYPFAGSRMLRDLLAFEGIKVGRLHVATLMKRMAIEAIYRKPNTSKPALGHKIYPYLLRNLPVTKPDQVWATDITYIPMAHGFVYLVAVVDWFSRRVLAWRVSISMEPISASRRWRKLWRNMASRKSSTRIRAANSPAPSSQACCSKAASPSAWTAKVRGVTMSLSNGFGGRSNTRRSISEHTIRCPRLELRSAPIWVFIIAEGHIRASTGRRPIRPTSTGHRMLQRRNWQMGIVALGPQRKQRSCCGHDALRATKLGQR
jgi:putative transposase